MSEQSSAAEANKATSRRWIEAFNDGDTQGEADARAADFTAHPPASIETATLDSAAWVEFLGGFTEGFPDLQVIIEDSVADDRLCAQRIRFEGTHTGVFQGLPPTNRKVQFSGIEVNRMVDGKVAEHWVEMDQVSLMQQLGLTVVPGPRLIPKLLGHVATKPFRRG
jgi:predicted ester cyclase